MIPDARFHANRRDSRTLHVRCLCHGGDVLADLFQRY